MHPQNDSVLSQQACLILFPLQVWPSSELQQPQHKSVLFSYGTEAQSEKHASSPDWALASITKAAPKRNIKKVKFFIAGLKLRSLCCCPRVDLNWCCWSRCTGKFPAHLRQIKLLSFCNANRILKEISLESNRSRMVHPQLRNSIPKDRKLT